MTGMSTDAHAVPDTSRLRRRTERAKPATTHIRKWTTVEDWSTPTADEYEAMPDGTRLAFTAGGSLHLTALRRSSRWTMLARTEVQARALAGLRSASRVRVGDAEGPEVGT